MHTIRQNSEISSSFVEKIDKTEFFLYNSSIIQVNIVFRFAVKGDSITTTSRREK